MKIFLDAVAIIKQTIEQIFDKDTFLAELICSLFREQDITVMSILTTLSMANAIIVLAITEIFGDGDPAAFLKKYKEALEKCLSILADVFKKLVSMAVEVVPAIGGNIVGTTLTFLVKAAGFIAEHTYLTLFSFMIYWVMVDAKI